MFEKKKVRRFVIMDGSDKRFLKEIMGVVEMSVGRPLIFKKRRIRCQRLNKSHPTMIVFTIRSRYEQFRQIRTILEKVYPEQCVFDAIF